MKRLERAHFANMLIALAGLVGAFAGPTAIGAQQQLAFDRRPRFMVPERGTGKPVEVDITRVTILRRRVALNQPEATVGRLLHEISRQAGVEFAYEPGTIPVSRTVGIRADSITVAAALTEILMDAGVDVLLKSSQQAVLLKRTLPGAVTGKVRDAKTGSGIVGAEVFLAHTRWRMTTDTNGRYHITEVEPGNYTLTVRRLGYAKQERTVTVRDDQEDTVDVALEPVVTRLNELVSTATGRRRRRDIANDVTLLNVDSIVRNAPITSVTDLLEARVPGLGVQRTSGAPGDPARLRLRGASSPLRSNDPIVVVDGVRTYAEQSASRSANLAADNFAAPSPLDYIDPNSIETIEVLKGPSAATLYGQDAANGVIVITTKRGKAGPTRWTASADYSRTRMEGQYPDLLVRWGHDFVTDVPVICPISGTISNNGRPCLADSVARFQMLNDPALTVLDHGRRTALTLGASGGTQVLTYAVTGSFQDELGLVKLPDHAADDYRARLGTVPDWMRRPQHFKQWQATSQLTARLSATADVSLKAAFSRQVQQRSSLEGELGSLMRTYFDRASGHYYFATAGTRYAVQATSRTLTNYYQRVIAGATQLTNGLDLNWRPRSWLAMNADAGLDFVQRDDESLLPHGANAADTSGFVNLGNGTSLLSTVNLRANATAPLGRGVQFRFAAGANYAGTSTDDQLLRTTNLPAGQTLGGSTISGGGRALRDDATFGWYLEPSISHPRFTFTAGLRLDGGSSYGSGVSGFQLPKFPRLGFTYVPSDESWFPFKDLFQSLRVRVAYGKASRQPGITDRLRVYGRTEALWAGGAYGDAVFLSSLGNTELRPERTTEIEGGFDADLLDNRLTLTVTGYRKTTDDALLPVPVAPSVYGYNVNVIRNIGVIRNTGLELTVGAQLVRSGPVTWGTHLLVSQNKDLVVRLGPGVQPFYTNGFTSAGGSRVAPGYPLFGRWAVPTVGYADVNGNGVLEPAEILVGDTAVYVGQTLPNYTASLHTTVSLWRGAVAVSAGFHYDDGLAQLNEGAGEMGAFSRGNNDPTAPLAEQVVVLSPASTFHEIQTVNTTRFNDLAVTYTVPPAVARRLGAQTLRISVMGSNLGLWTNYRGLDPNVNRIPTGNDVVGGAVLPQPRSWQVRVNATY